MRCQAHYVRNETMDSRFDSKVTSIRDSWSEEERETRKLLAGAMQLQLRQLAILAELSTPSPTEEKRSLSVASAC